MILKLKYILLFLLLNSLPLLSQETFGIYSNGGLSKFLYDGIADNSNVYAVNTSKSYYYFAWKVGVYYNHKMSNNTFYRIDLFYNKCEASNDYAFRGVGYGYSNAQMILTKNGSRAILGFPFFYGIKSGKLIYQLGLIPIVSIQVSDNYHFTNYISNNGQNLVLQQDIFIDQPYFSTVGIGPSISIDWEITRFLQLSYSWSYIFTKSMNQPLSIQPRISQSEIGFKFKLYTYKNDKSPSI